METNNLNLTDGEQYEYSNKPLNGTDVRMRRDIATGEVLFNADDLTRALGLNCTFKEYLGTDDGLDFLNSIKKKHPEMPLFDKSGGIKDVL